MLSFLGGPLTLCWYFSLKCGAVLAKDKVLELVQKVTPDAVSDENFWSAEVAAPMIRLATHTMRDLSVWGVGVGYVAVLSWVMSLARLANFMSDKRVADGGFALDGIFNLLPCLAFGIAPFVIAFDVAQISSMCDQLLNSTNELRLSWPSTMDAQKIHSMTFPLIVTLKSANHNQGLGFVIFSKVVDLKTLNFIIVSIGSVIGGLLPLIFVLTSEASVKAEEHACTLTTSQIMTIQGAMMSGNESCKYNQTISEVLGM